MDESVRDTVVVEVCATPLPRDALRRIGGEAEAIGNAGSMAGTIREFATLDLEDVQRGIARVCKAITDAMREAQPDACDVEIALGFKAGAKVPVIVSGEANASVKVTLHWKRQANPA